MTNPKCPHCKHEALIEHQYIYGGVVYDDSYCGWCGKNWPRPIPKGLTPLISTTVETPEPL